MLVDNHGKLIWKRLNRTLLFSLCILLPFLDTAIEVNVPVTVSRVNKKKRDLISSEIKESLHS